MAEIERSARRDGGAEMVQFGRGGEGMRIVPPAPQLAASGCKPEGARGDTGGQDEEQRFAPGRKNEMGA